MNICKCCGNECKNKYCSRSCSVTINNRGLQRNLISGAFVKKKCLLCETLTTNPLYCSRQCFNDHRNEKIVEDIRNGKYKVVTSSQSVRKFLKKERGCKCEKCKNDYWMGEPIPLNVHHKDGDAYNNHPSNIQLLCLNCHGLTDNYGRKNKTSTRTYRYR
jgi:hypothetical protein